MILSFGQPNERARTGETGFTLIEIMMTMVIMGLLVAMVAPSLDAYVPKSRLDSAAKVLAANLIWCAARPRFKASPTPSSWTSSTPAGAACFRPSNA